ncbi:preprotein translocase subunit SecG [Lactococcus hodotermopsidis]|uniref:Protein-export membrane protein SecG n=1 Tax=Pseudolactococcus hodotermopsidis TaxID=2709157 RepID=A0A6A0BDE2_9LACT|nr:preprotein translocase subunit SecG [Lactococcus hodotermopsidis]GFH42685.1 preprotein translocase subunit SecG [Lactococcus hodotermopsidis]
MELLYNLLIYVLIALSVVLVISIMIQPSKQDGGVSAFTGGGDELFERRKARGFEAVMQRFTGVMIAIWLAVGFALVVLSTR